MATNKKTEETAEEKTATLAEMQAQMAATLAPGTLVCAASDITGPHQSIVTLPAAKWRSRKYDFNKIPTIFLIGPATMRP